MRRTMRFAIVLSAFALAASLLVGPAAARADFAYTFSLTATVTEVDDLAMDSTTGLFYHLLPDVFLGDPITATGTFASIDRSDLLFTDASIDVQAPAGLSFAVPHASLGDGLSGGLFHDPANPAAGFELNLFGFFLPTEHLAVFPHQDNFDTIHGAKINGLTFEIDVHHLSRRLSLIDPIIHADITSLELTAVPEPGSLSLLAIGLAGGWGLLKRRAYQNRHAA